MNLQITKLFLLFALVLFNLMGKCVSRRFKDFQVAGLNRHNEYRKRHQVDPLVLDAGLNTIADKCANYYSLKGRIDHGCQEKTQAGVGENMYLLGYQSRDPSKTVEEAVDEWYDDVDSYDFDKADAKNGDGRTTERFTQVVWKDSKELGIGFASHNFKEYVVCVYRPHGDYYGDIYNKKNVFPPIESIGIESTESNESTESSESTKSTKCKCTESTESTKSTYFTDTAPAFTSSAYLICSLIILGGVVTGF